ncbi:MAG: aminotransferase class V-fold PLP-dependent enzyme [Rhodothermales bacterium]
MTIDELRQHFPHTRHGIYMNHAAVAPMSTPVVEALQAYIAERHETHVENFFDMEPVIASALDRAAAAIGTVADRVAFVPNTSYALNLLAQGLDWQQGDRIAIPGCEFPANVYPFVNLRDRGVEVDYIPDRDGVFTLEDVEAMLTKRTRLLTVSWVQFLSGFKADLRALGALCRERGILFCVDAIQGLGAFGLDVASCGIDFLACGGHKWLMASQGIGFLYVTEALQDRLKSMAGWLHGPIDWSRLTDYELTFHPTARRYRLGTMNMMGVVSLNAALGLREQCGVDWCAEQVLDRAALLRDGFLDAGHALYGSSDPEAASGIVTLRHPDAGRLFHQLQDEGIQIALRNGLLRFAPTYYNTREEALAVVDRLKTEVPA